jgi:transposase
MVLRVEDEGWEVADAAAAAGLSQRRAYHWVARYRMDGEIALQDRRSTPGRYRDRAPRERDGEIERLRGSA